MVAEKKAVIESGFKVPARWDAEGQQGLDLGCEIHSPLMNCVEQGLDTEPVTNGDQAVLALVGDNNGELAAKFFQRLQAVAQVEV
jgi:hypothetical protein